MWYTYDCEFLEDGKKIDLISIGIVREDGREFYGVSNEFDTIAVANNWWMMENVMSSIAHVPTKVPYFASDYSDGVMVDAFHVTDENAASRAELRRMILDFVGDEAPEWWAWYSSYDHVALMQLMWGPMINQPPHWPFTTYDIAMLHKEAGYPAMPRQPYGKHNALDDARFNVIRYNYLRNLLNEK